MSGYFRKRGDKWSYTLDIGDDPITGKRKQKTKTGFKTKKEAQIAASQLLQEITHGTYIAEQNVLFKDFSLEWLELYRNNSNVKESTIRVRNHEIKRLMDYFAHIKMKDISKKLYQNALSDLKKRGYADNTLDGAHATGRMIFKKAVELDLIKVDPTQYAKVPKSKKSVEQLEQEEESLKYLEKNELALFLTAAKEKGLDRDIVIFMTLAYTGMRVGELCALKWKDIDFLNGTLSITKTYYNPNNNTKEYQLLPPKTKKSRRSIVIDKVVLDELETHRAFQNEIRMAYRKTYYDEGFVIARMEKNKGYPEFIKTIENRMTRLLKLSGLNETLTPHSLRHTHTSLLAEAGVGLQEIMERLGHTDDQTTKNVYLHVTKDMKKEASQKFAELMRNL
jgi:integrase